MANQHGGGQPKSKNEPDRFGPNCYALQSKPGCGPFQEQIAMFAPDRALG